MLERGKMDCDLMEIVGIDSLALQDYLLRQVDAAGANFIPKILDTSLYDEVIDIADYAF